MPEQDILEVIEDLNDTLNFVKLSFLEKFNCYTIAPKVTDVWSYAQYHSGYDMWIDSAYSPTGILFGQPIKREIAKVKSFHATVILNKGYEGVVPLE